jgi:hypothetical protein
MAFNMADLSYPVPFHPMWEVFDSTKIQDYLDCPRQFFYKRILGWERETPFSNDLQFGKAWHKAMEILYKGGFSDANVLTAYHEGFLPTYREVFPPDSDALFDPKTPDNALIGLSAYCVYPANKRDFDLYDVIKTEIAGFVPLDEEVEIVYKMDLLARRKDNGKFCAFEHKSKKNSFSRTWTDQWEQSIQIGNYNHALCVMLGNEDLSNVEGVLVNGTAFLKTKVDFARVPVHKHKDLMVEHVWTVREIIDRMRADIEFLAECSPSDRIMQCFPRNPQSCTKYYGCEMAAFCSAWPNPLQRCEVPPPGYIVRHWDPMAEEHSPTERIDLALKEYV